MKYWILYVENVVETVDDFLGRITTFQKDIIHHDKLARQNIDIFV